MYRPEKASDWQTQLYYGLECISERNLPNAFNLQRPDCILKVLGFRSRQ